jgi:hypothetical protein
MTLLPFLFLTLALISLWIKKEPKIWGVLFKKPSVNTLKTLTQLAPYSPRAEERGGQVGLLKEENFWP